MGSNLSKAEKFLALVAVAAITAFVGFFTLINKKSVSSKFNFATETGINYKMARPDQAYSEYSLDGRELDQVYEGLPEAKKKEIAKKKAEIAKAKAKAKVEAKKKDEDKKKQAQVKLKQAKEAQAQASNKSRQEELKKLLDNKAKSQSVTAEARPAFIAPVSAPDNSVQEDETGKAKPKKSYAEWRALIFSSPTSENIGQFVTAFRKGEVTSTELQAMATDLLDQNDNTLKGLGLAILRSVPSLQSLSQLVHEQPNLPASYQSYVDSALVAYFLPQNISYLKSALQTRDQMLLGKVLNLLQTNLPKISQNDFSMFNERGRGSVSDVNVSIQSFVVLVPALTTLSSSNDETGLAGTAQQVLSLIQTYNNVARN
ncbi:MAG: hypothetical protein K0R29_1807 [Pseudobdellovibrio sp.]|nr:hypothetical protein [Pseudobdellovibrio sp.]